LSLEANINKYFLEIKNELLICYPMQQLPTIDAALIKLTGVFSYSKKKISLFTAAGFDSMPLTDNLPEASDPDFKKKKDAAIQSTRKFYRDYYYREFYSLMYTGEAENQPMRALIRRNSLRFSFSMGKDATFRTRTVTCTCQELFLFGNETGIMALTLEPEVLDFHHISDVTFALRSFDTEIEFEGKKYEFWDFISTEMLAGIPLRGANVQADDYSGSKFKMYSVINTVEPDDGTCYERDRLVYEIGTGSMIGTMGSKGYNAPSEEYFAELMQNSIKVFNNYTGLALLDSFTVIGQNVYQTKDKNYFQYNIYNRVYFGIYVFNLFLRYNIFRFNAVFTDKPIKTRDEFQDFLNKFNYSHISFNFLPNIFYKKIHDALNIDEEIEQFEKRLDSLATSIQEEQEKRQATLLGIVSVLTGLSSASDILDLVEKLRTQLNWSPGMFYTLLITVVVILAVPLLAYLFPEYAKKVKKRLGKKTKK
jgi:hypothetical protein